jgi:hypothetical protein
MVFIEFTELASGLHGIAGMAAVARKEDRDPRNSREETKMKIILEKLGLIRPTVSIGSNQLHMAPWHPLFYKAVQVHILETTATRSRFTR